MPITEEQILQAQDIQHTAAHDLSAQVRLVAGPGTGKSFAIQERVHWLLDNSVEPDAIFVVSFTRASARDLRRRVLRYCHDRDQPNVDQVNLSTLHSLALRTLRAANLLTYPALPSVMDNWELENVFDREFSRASGYRAQQPGLGYPPGRCRDIRRDYEAFCGTGQWEPPNYIPPEPQISQPERTDYDQFHHSRTQVYSCVLPGEILRQCIENIAAGVLDPAGLLGIEHLIVDEYQDLNPSDLEFVDYLIDREVVTFVAGDDDQSIYSFRFATTEGIQSFSDRHQQSSTYTLEDCFRSTTDVLSSGQHLISTFQEPHRIEKHIRSLHTTATPPEHGWVGRWRFRSGVREARAIAGSCQRLIEAGIPAAEIMILVSNRPALLSGIKSELESHDVLFEPPRADSFIDTRSGRFLHALLRIACNPDDYVAHRLILGLRPNIGPAACNTIVELVLANKLNYRDLFYTQLPDGVFAGRASTALNHARASCVSVANWESADTLSSRKDEFSQILVDVFGQAASEEWQSEVADLPEDMTLEELRDYFWADTDEQRAALLEWVYERLEIEIPEGGLVPNKVRIMTMHGAKGLGASVVFIPGLEEEVIPGNRRAPYPGLVLEAARLIYVSITRAAAACILSFAGSRFLYGQQRFLTRSRYIPHLGGPFQEREAGLSRDEVDAIVNSYGNL